MLGHGVLPNSMGIDEAQARAALILGGQIKVQAYSLAYSDGYLAIALVAALVNILIAFMKPMKIIFDSNSPAPVGGIKK
jgi:DHA2 family multidrug resistance protein